MQHSLPCVIHIVMVNALLLGSGVHAQFSSEQKMEMLDMHNRLRAAAYPPAALMNIVIWSDKLEAQSQRAANLCKGDHTEDTPGENIYSGYRFNATDIALNWYTEKLMYTFDTGSCVIKGEFKKNICGHYCQVVADRVVNMGCGINKCIDKDDPKKFTYHTFCQYDSGQGSPPYAKGDWSCSACPSDRALCLSEMCVNRSMLSMPEVLRFEPNATALVECKLKCLNCGVTTMGSAPGDKDCYCKCPAGTSGDFCETKDEKAQLTCSACRSLGTPCLNGGTDLAAAGTSCSCQCTEDYLGKQCQIYKPHHLNGVRLSIGSGEPYIAHGLGYLIPMAKREFRTLVWPLLRPAIAKAVNSFCNTDDASFALCCPTGKKPPAAKDLIAAADVGYLDNGDMFTDPITEAIGVVIYANISAANNLLCPTSRRKRATTQPMVPQAALQSAIQKGNETIISPALRTNSDATILSLESYVSFTAPKLGSPACTQKIMHGLAWVMSAVTLVLIA